MHLQHLVEDVEMGVQTLSVAMPVAASYCPSLAPRQSQATRNTHRRDGGQRHLPGLCYLLCELPPLLSAIELRYVFFRLTLLQVRKWHCNWALSIASLPRRKHVFHVGNSMAGSASATISPEILSPRTK
jgi:hypothetical protein